MTVKENLICVRVGVGLCYTVPLHLPQEPALVHDRVATKLTWLSCLHSMCPLPPAQTVHCAAKDDNTSPRLLFTGCHGQDTCGMACRDFQLHVLAKKQKVRPLYTWQHLACWASQVYLPGSIILRTPSVITTVDASPSCTCSFHPYACSCS